LGGESMILGHDRFPHIETVVVKLDHLAAIHAQKVAVSGGIGEIGVIMRRLLAQADLTDESAADEKGEGTINRRPRNFGVPLSGAGQQGFGGKVVLAAKSNLRDRPPLASHT